MSECIRHWAVAWMLVLTSLQVDAPAWHVFLRGDQTAPSAVAATFDAEGTPRVAATTSLDSSSTFKCPVCHMMSQTRPALGGAGVGLVSKGVRYHCPVISSLYQPSTHGFGGRGPRAPPVIL